LFVPFKVNIGKRQKALVYRIKETRNDLAKIEWLGEADTTADEALNKEAKKPAARDAREKIIEMFTRMREWPSDLWWSELTSEGITNHRFNQVREVLNIPKARRVSQPNGDITYIWWVPPNWPHFSTP
jgi:crotonobetainyl-CoA:carnitine CoA-transferase CaiB-like acyl-CoA transferase